MKHPRVSAVARVPRPRSVLSLRSAGKQRGMYTYPRLRTFTVLFTHVTSQSTSVRVALKGTAQSLPRDGCVGEPL